jgi:hypothetical protein
MRPPDSAVVRHPRLRARLEAFKRWWSTPAAVFPPVVPSSVTDYPVPPHAPSPQVTRLRAANANPGLGHGRQGDLSITYCTCRVTSLPD